MVDFRKIEEKWQKRWEKEKIFWTKKSNKNNLYILEMFPYPSGSGLHMGHAFNYSIGDAYARYNRMKGFNVLYPMGYDSFGLPAENAAIKEKTHPKKFTEKAIKNFIKQQKNLGLSYDWDRILMTSDPDYYHWNQYFFIKFLEKGLAYRKKSNVNWCPKCQTVLANEQVHNGKCWRHEDTDVRIKQLEQWFLKITKYAEELLDYAEKLDWPERIKTMQKNWIGKSQGVNINFKLQGSNEKISVFTTRPDTIYGVTFIVFAPEHPKVMELVKGTPYEKKAKDFIDKVLLKEKFERISEKTEKEGIFIGKYAIHPLTKKKVPIYVANFVLLDYGTGIIMAVPAHDQRDLDFAEKYKIPIKTVIEPLEKNDVNIILHDSDESKIAEKIRSLSSYKEQVSPEEKSYTVPNKSKKLILKHLKNKKIFEDSNNFVIKYSEAKGIIQKMGAYLGEGILINSGQFNGINNKEAITKMAKHLSKINVGGVSTTYKLRDWLISRQRYWGTPIPIIYCDDCGVVPVPEKDLPVLLPEDIKFGKGNPLETNKNFLETKCPKCNKKARRETDTMDTFFDSSWYFLRYIDNKNKKQPFDKKKIIDWMPVDQYIGGAEHACMHLIYARFFTKALRDMKYLDIDEPFIKLFNQGMLHGSDGYVMSKSRGNVVLPEDISKIYGIDTARLFLMSVASPDKDLHWSEKGIEGSARFMRKVISYFDKYKNDKKLSPKGEHKMNKTIMEVTKYIEEFKYNLAIISMRNFFESLPENQDKKAIETFLKLFSPFCPHISEELWHKMGNKSLISLEKWPVCNENKINEEFENQEEQQEKLIFDVNNVFTLIKRKKKEEPKKLFIYSLPKEIQIYEEIKERLVSIGFKETNFYSVSDRKKYDPENKSKKSKPGKPAFYME